MIVMKIHQEMENRLKQKKQIGYINVDGKVS